jgi:hypothetical protein
MIPDCRYTRHDHGSDVLFLVGAGDGNRTRTISLGIRQIPPSDHSDLGIRRTASDRRAPCDTRANGPPMARGVMQWPGVPRATPHVSHDACSWRGAGTSPTSAASPPMQV